MHIRVWAAAMLAGAMIGGGILLEAHTAELCRGTELLLLSAMACGERAPLLRAEDRWAASQSYLAALITHDRLDAVTESLAQACAFSGTAEREEYCAALASALIGLRHIREYDRLSWKTFL